MAPGLAKEWFIPGDGIDRGVISSDIQRYLGNDATVRPGLGNGPNEGVRGYWVKAYRNLTTAMVDDLRASSRRWQQERERSGTRDQYADSHAYTVAGGMPPRHQGDSPLGAMDPRDPRHRDAPAGRGNRVPDRMHGDDRMAVDPPFVPPGPGRFPPDRGDRFGVDERGYGPPGSAVPPHGLDSRDPRAQYRDPQLEDMRQQPDRFAADASGYGRDPRDDRYFPRADMRGAPPRGDPRDARGPPGYNPMSGPPQDYGRAPDHYNAGMSNNNYGGPPTLHAPPRDPRDAAYVPPAQFGAPPGPPRNDGRDPRFPPASNNFGQDLRDPRDPRYAYPSPAQTVIDPRDNFQSPPQHNAFGHSAPNQGNPNAQYDQYGGRPPPPLNNTFPGQNGAPGPPSHVSGAMPGQMSRPNQGNLGSRPTGPPADMGGDPRDPRRRRLQ